MYVISWDIHLNPFFKSENSIQRGQYRSWQIGFWYLLWKFYIKSWPASQFPLSRLPNIQFIKRHSIAVLYLVFAILSLHSSERKSPLSSLKKKKTETQKPHTRELTLFLSATRPFLAKHAHCVSPAALLQARPQEAQRRRQGTKLPWPALRSHPPLGKGPQAPAMPHERHAPCGAGS